MIFYTLLFSSALFLGTTSSPILRVSEATSTTVEPKDAYKAMLNIFVYDAEGKLLREGTAFYIDAQRNAATAYSILQGASRAEVVDFKGNRFEVHRILGANSTFDLVRFSTSGSAKVEYLAPVSTPASVGKTALLLNYTTNKKEIFPTVSVTGDEAYNEFKYYTLSAENEEANFHRPIVDAVTGELIGITQKNVSKSATGVCAIDARFLSALTISSMSAFNSDLRGILIPKALPNNPKDALTYIYMMPTSDTEASYRAYDDFVQTYPDAPEGYTGRAIYKAAQKNYAGAEADFALALEKAQSPTRPDSLMHPDAVHYQLSDLIYSTVIRQTDTETVFPGWTLERAREEAVKAYAIEPYTLYKVQEGHCLFALKNYSEAYAAYAQACRDKEYASAETFFSAARALELSGGDSTEVLTLMDSVIAHVPQPVAARDAQYYLERSQRLLRAERFREAVFDYNEYEKAIGPRNLNDKFYYLRSQAEMSARMYQQALDDIRTAIATASEPLPYRLEEAFILLRVGEFDDAITAASNLLKDLPESPDCYKVIGIAYGELGKKQEAQENLQHALRLGDTSVVPFIEKYN